MSNDMRPFRPRDQKVSDDLLRELNFQIHQSASQGGNFVCIKIMDAMALADRYKTWEEKLFERPPLHAALLAERQLVVPYATATTARKIQSLNRSMHDARVVTNNTLRRVQAVVRELRDLCLHLLDVSTESTPETSDRYDALSTTIDELFPPEEDASR